MSRARALLVAAGVVGLGGLALWTFAGRATRVSSPPPAEPQEATHGVTPTAPRIELALDGTPEPHEDAPTPPKTYPVRGLVTLDPDWAAAKGVTLADVRIELEALGPDELLSEWRPAPEGVEGYETLPTPPSLDEHGAFHLSIATPHAPFLLRLRLKRLEPIERLVRPTPGAEFEESFRFP